MNIALIGSGNVATHLGPALQAAGHSIVQVYSRNLANAELLAAALNAKAVDGFEQLDRNADLYLIMTSDDAIAEVAAALKVNGIVAHTSGSVEMAALANSSENIGVLWTPQTFSKGTKVGLDEAPIFVEANNEEALSALKNTALGLGTDVREADSAQRKGIHLAAVIGSNFSNFMYTLAEGLLKEQGQDLEVLGPLLQETLRKALEDGPIAGQTGPARRGDKKVIAEHLVTLTDKPALKALYEELSSAIIKHYGQ